MRGEVSLAADFDFGLLDKRLIMLAVLALLAALQHRMTQQQPGMAMNMNDPLGIALIRCGTVGSGVAKLLLEQPARLAARAGRPLVLRRVVVRDDCLGGHRGLRSCREGCLSEDFGARIAVPLVNRQ